MLVFNQPSITDLEKQFVAQALAGKLCGDGPFTQKASALFAKKTAVSPMILTTSCTHALEMAALLCDVQPGDEVILPSFTFSSTANAFALRKAKLVFCDIRKDTLNMDETLLPAMVTEKTKVIIPVHYAGVACEMDAINELARKHRLWVVEDAAQAVGSTYKGLPCGALGDMGCYSFHETKNYSMGEGGGIYIREEALRQKAEMVREKGTDRSLFLRGDVDKYTWRLPGSSYLPSDVLAALLCAQLERFEEIMEKRLHIWHTYHNALASLDAAGWRRPVVPDNVTHNAHMYYWLAPTPKERDRFMVAMKEKGVSVVSHYEPLHAAPMGIAMGYRPEQLPTTMEMAARLVRLPMWADLADEALERIIAAAMDVAT